MNEAFLIDECLSPYLESTAHEKGFEAYHVAHLGMSGASDHSIFEFVKERGLIFVTNNRDDFISLVKRADLHAGLIVIVPQCRRQGQIALFEVALNRLKEIGSLINKVIEVGENGQVTVFDLPTATTDSCVEHVELGLRNPSNLGK